MQVKLLSQTGNYKDKNTGEDKTYVNFFLECGNERIPIEVKNFSTQEKQDKAYGSRRTVLKAFAEPLPDKVASN